VRDSLGFLFWLVVEFRLRRLDFIKSYPAQ
jgi:hypothetical protein